MPDRSSGFASATRRRPSSTDGTGYLSLTYRDAAALPWLDTDNLADRSRTFFDAQANPLKTVLPDDNYPQEQFNNFSEVTSYTDPNGATTAPLFRTAFRTRAGAAGYRWYFDYDGDGDVDGRDHGQFNRRFGHP